MGSFRVEDNRGSGGGGGLLFGTGTSIFADNTARDAYFTANVGQLTQYNDNEFLLIQVGTGFQRRKSNAWIIVTNIVKGKKGDEGKNAGDIEVLHKADIVDPIPFLYNMDGEKTATTAANTAAVKALTAGILTIDGVSTAAVDFSGVVDGVAGLLPIIKLLKPAIDAVSGLAGYISSYGYINGAFYFRIIKTGGNVGVLSGNLVTAMGLGTFTEKMFVPKSDSIIITPPSSGYWRELRFFGILVMSRPGVESTFKATLISDGTDTYCWFTALSNTGVWWEFVSSNEASGLYYIGKATIYSSTYSDFLYNIITGEITWDKQTGIGNASLNVWKLKSLFVIGVRGV